MTIRDLIQKVSEEKPNSFTNEKLISFINEIEVEVAEQFNVPAPKYTDYYALPEVQPTYETWNNGIGFYIYENGEYVSQEGLNYDATKTYYVDAVLLAPAPYDQLYVSYVMAKIDYANEEMPNYQNNVAQHVQDFKDFIDWVVSKSRTVENSFPSKLINIM